MENNRDRHFWTFLDMREIFYAPSRLIIRRRTRSRDDSCVELHRSHVGNLGIKRERGGDAKHLVQVELFAEYYGYDGDGCKYCVSLA